MACDQWPYDITCLPAGWPADPDATIAELVDAMTAVQLSSYAFAVDVLADLTLRQFGVCDVVARPCSLSCAVSAGFLRMDRWFTPTLYGGRVYNVCACSVAATCRCGTPAAAVRLAGPIDSVTQVRVDGDVVDPGDYRVDDGVMLVRTDGGVWPLRQNLNAPATADDTFEVQYRRGTPLPAGGRRALSVLMVEVAKARCGDNTCALPARVTNVVREGVTYSMLDDPSGLLNAGRTGIPDIDMWLAAINPHGTRSRMAVYSPDLARR